MPSQQADDKPEVQAITIRLPKDMYEALRRQAFEERTSINALIVEAVRDKQARRAKPQTSRVTPGPVPPRRA